MFNPQASPDAWGRLAELDQVQRQIAALQQHEVALRCWLFSQFFPGNIEGTETGDIGNGYQLKGTGKLTRTISSPEALDAGIKGGKIPAKTKKELIVASVGIKLKVYRSLSEAQRLSVDTGLIIKPALPSLKIIAPGTVDADEE